MHNHVVVERRMGRFTIVRLWLAFLGGWRSQRPLRNGYLLRLGDLLRHVKSRRTPCRERAPFRFAGGSERDGARSLQMESRFGANDARTRGPGGEARKFFGNLDLRESAGRDGANIPLPPFVRANGHGSRLTP